MLRILEIQNVKNRSSGANGKEGRESAHRGDIVVDFGERSGSLTAARGGEDGIRTHETLMRSTPLAGERLRPLGHLSGKGEIAGTPWHFKRFTQQLVKFPANYTLYI